jgi:hypothetical protein
VCSLRRALRGLEHLLALRWRRSKETLQPELRQGVCVQLRGSWRILLFNAATTCE